MTFKWRGKPVFVRHRPQSEIDEVRAVDTTTLRHPQTDQERVQVRSFENGQRLRAAAGWFVAG